MNLKVAFRFLPIVSCLACLPSLFKATPCEFDDEPQYDVVIAGLGWAGIGAMYELQLFNNYNLESSKVRYIGIEADDYYGGRIIGGELVSGAEKNPIGQIISELFSQNKKDENYLLYHHQTWSDIYVSRNNGRAMGNKEVNIARKAWADAYECLQREGRDDSRSMFDVLDLKCNYNLTARSPLEKLFSEYELDWEFVLDPKNASAKGNEPLWTYYLMQDKDWFVTAEGKYRTNGSIIVPPNLAKVADKAVKSYITDYGGETILNKMIDKITYDKNGVEIKADEDCYTAEKALVTYSISALVQAEEDGMFVPNIDAKIDAIENTFYIDKSSLPFNNTMGLYKLLFVQLNYDTWKDEANVPNNEFIFVLPDDSDDLIGRSCSRWQSFDRFKDEFFDGSRAFACTLITEDFKKLAPNGVLGESVARKLIKRLFLALGIADLAQSCVSVNSDDHIDLFPPIQDGPPCVYEMRNGVNPRWKGAWSTLKPGWTNGNYTAVREPLPPPPNDSRLYFAGEAYCPVWVGFQHGAWDSGRLQGREMLFSLRDFSDSEKEDWIRFSDTFLTPPRCEIPDGTPPIRKSKTVP